MPPLQMAGIRQLLGGFVMLLFFLIKGERWPQRKRMAIHYSIKFSKFFIDQWFKHLGFKIYFFRAWRYYGSHFPLMAGSHWLIFCKTKMPEKAIIGLLLGFGGVCIIFYEHLNDFLNPDFRFGIFLSLIATWTWAFGTIYTKKHAANFNPYFSLGLQMVISGITLTCIAYTTVPPIHIPITAIPWQSWAVYAYLVSLVRHFFYRLPICIAKSAYRTGFIICIYQSYCSSIIRLADLFMKH